MSKSEQIGIVLIGRNEGERLRQCLLSIRNLGHPIVYVDSGSTDDSVCLARNNGADVIRLRADVAFSAARARNEGYRQLRQSAADLKYVQFLDGDCELVAGWIENSAAFLETHPEVAAVCGRRRERYPTRSVYNKLCDMEWDTPPGVSTACGGDALMRVEAFEQVGHYRPELIAGEEPELCSRLRGAGWTIWRLDEEMTIHDAAITRFRQWWRRGVRTGYGYAQVARLTKGAANQLYLWEARRALVWGLAIPAACLSFGVLFGPWGYSTLSVYGFQFLRQTIRNHGPLKQKASGALFQLLSRFAEAHGHLKYFRDELARRKSHVLDYK